MINVISMSVSKFRSSEYSILERPVVLYREDFK